jgi:hypothetical protein
MAGVAGREDLVNAPDDSVLAEIVEVLAQLLVQDHLRPPAPPIPEGEPDTPAHKSATS